MLQNPQRTFRYLNRNNRWLDLHRHGLEVGPDGSARLASLPLLAGELPANLATLPQPNGPAGMAIAPDGTRYFTDPSGHRVLMISPCPPAEQPDPAGPADRSQKCAPCAGERPAEQVVPPAEGEPFTPVPCLGGYGQLPTQFDNPRGLLLHPVRGALFVADSSNGRIQIFDPHTFQLLDVWGVGPPDRHELSQPWTLVADAEGNIYVVDAGADDGSRRVLKFDLRGELLPDFWTQVQATLEAQGLTLDYPSDIAVAQVAGRTRVYILDAQLGRVLSFNRHGRYRRMFESEALRGAVGLAVNDHALYVGSSTRRVLQYRLDGTLVGAALGYEGPVAALLLDHGSLWVHTGASMLPIRLEIGGAYAPQGFLWGGPFTNYSHLREEWHRLLAQVEIPPETHFQLYIYASADPQADPGDPHSPTPPWEANAIDLETHLRDLEGLSSKDVWLRVPLDTPEAAFRAMVPVKRRYGVSSDNEGWEPLDFVWIGAAFWSEGIGSPALSQMQIDFDHVTYLPHLPAIYGEHPQGRQVLGRFLSLFESVFEDVEAEISALPALFDPAAAPAGWLPWLASWLNVELREDWDVTQQREVIVAAFDLHGQRGTRRGLEAAIRRDLAVEVVIEEPIVQTDWWSLPEESTSPAADTMSILGFTTVLAAAEPQGAVLGSTATLDGSHLITEEELGAPLFQDLAHRFTVQWYRGAHLTPQTLASLAALLEREKPAHTSYHLCLIEPCMRVGFQARVGIDTIVAGPGPATRLDDPTRSGTQMILNGEQAGRLGEQSQIGHTTRLGNGPASS